MKNSGFKGFVLTPANYFLAGIIIVAISSLGFIVKLSEYVYFRSYSPNVGENGYYAQFAITEQTVIAVMLWLLVAAILIFYFIVAASAVKSLKKCGTAPIWKLLITTLFTVVLGEFFTAMNTALYVIIYRHYLHLQWLGFTLYKILINSRIHMLLAAALCSVGLVIMALRAKANKTKLHQP